MLSLTVQFQELRDPSQLEGAFSALIRVRKGALLEPARPFDFWIQMAKT